ncbi:MAG: ABC transporter substrate-binding protein [Treponema sp.]|jgi:simple sugar transport system substrate-binding protein|nr:ABC transporter substrate-binding protein [Treponema sp.]
MNRRHFFLFFFPAFFCLLFFSCTKKTADTKGIILGFSQIGAESAWRNCNTRSVQEAAADAGVQLLFFNAEQKQENQIKAIRSFIAYQVDVIAFVPIVSDGWENVLEEARVAQIPVLICDREINIYDETLYAGYIGTNMYEQGRRSAEYLIKKFTNPDTGKISADRSKPVKIVELQGTEGSSPAIMRAKGFRDVLAEYPEFKIIYSESGDFLRSKGYELMRTIPEELWGFDVIYSHNDSMTLGAIDALKEKNIVPGKDVVVISIDAEQAAINAMQRGEINCVVECNPKQGPDIMRLVSRLVQNEPIPRVMYMIEEVFTEWDNLSAVAPRGY